MEQLVMDIDKTDELDDLQLDRWAIFMNVVG